MSRYGIIVGLAVVLAWAGPAAAQTPTPVTVASPSPDGHQNRDRQRPSTGGEWLESPVTFEGGAQIGKTSLGASLLTFVARGNCLVDPSGDLGDGAETIVSCTATGAIVGDMGLAAIQSTEDVSDVHIKRVRVTANMIQFTIGSYTAGQDPGVLSINYLVIR